MLYHLTCRERRSGTRLGWLSGGALSAGFVLHSMSTAASEETATAPVAEKRPHKVWFGAPLEGAAGADAQKGEQAMTDRKFIVDPYYWLRDDERKNEEVLAHLHKENDFAVAKTKHLEELRKTLYEEMRSHIKETDASAGYDSGPFTYYTRTVEGLGYAIHCRRPRGAALETSEEVILDENEVSKQNTKSSQTNVGDVEESPNHTMLAYTVDESGYETYDLKFKTLGPDAKEIDEVVPEVDSGVEWGKDESTIFYTKMDDQHRPYQLWRHTMGTPASEDELLYTEEDDLFWMGIGKTLDNNFLVLETASKETAEVHVLNLNEKKGKLSVVAPRRFGVLYDVDHRDGNFYIVTNDENNKNFKLSVAPATAPGPENWKPLLDAKGDTVFGNGADVSPGARMLGSLTCFKDFIAVSGRYDGYRRVWVIEMEDGAKGDGSGGARLARECHEVQFADTAATPYIGSNAEFDTDKIRVGYTSMVAPSSTFDYTPKTRKLELVKEKEVPNYDPSLYATEVLQATAHDGQKIPVTIMYRKDKYEEGKPMPLHLYGYGSYGASMDPSFSATRLSLLDRGVAYAIAHIRGGSEMGRAWYESMGKYLTKMNTFFDFISAAEHLVDLKLTTSDMMSMEGRSAGGLLMGAVLNMRPDLFKAAIAGVPFVDLMVTMCDASIPLTVGEWEEWGNPNDAKYYYYMRMYSPMDNVVPQHYPNVLATAGLHDPRVAYWEPAKWVQHLRDNNLGDSEILLKMDLEAGHFSASDRYKYLRELAFDHAFVLDKLGLAEK